LPNLYDFIAGIYCGIFAVYLNFIADLAILVFDNMTKFGGKQQL
jgi:hypothetical protein